MPDDFVTHAVGFLKSERQRIESQHFKATAEQKAKEAKCPAFWDEVSGKVTRIGGEIEKTMGEQVFSFPTDNAGKSCLIVNAALPSGRRALTARYDAQTHRISYTIDAGNGETFTPYMSNGETLYSDGSQDCSSGQMAQKMVHALIGFKAR